MDKNNIQKGDLVYFFYDNELSNRGKTKVYGVVDAVDEKAGVAKVNCQTSTYYGYNVSYKKIKSLTKVIPERTDTVIKVILRVDGLAPCCYRDLQGLEAWLQKDKTFTFINTPQNNTIMINVRLEGGMYLSVPLRYVEFEEETKKRCSGCL